MGIERTPEERAADAEKDARIEAVLGQARANAASVFVADLLDEPADVCEQWINALWDGLRDNLDDEERLTAIVRLLEPAARYDARRLVREMQRGPGVP